MIGEALGGGGNGGAAAGKRPPKRERKAGGGARRGRARTSSRRCRASIFKVAVAEGDEVEEGALVCVIEAMKMENEITAHRAGKITSLPVEVGAAINSGDLIAKIE